MGAEVYDVFISYARVDWRHAANIDSILRTRELTSFFDRRNLPPGLPWVRELEKALNAAKAAIVLIGPNGLGNIQQYECDLAIYRQTRDPSFLIVPVILPGSRIDRPFNFLQILTWIDFSDVSTVSDAPAELERLVTAVQGGRISTADAVREAICPYRGLDAFREEDSAFFFGRGSVDDPKSQVGQLVRKVHEHPFVMVVGRSGSGKSSLVYAGLLPALRRERDRFWSVLALRPGSSPLRALAAAFNPRADGEGAAEYQSKLSNEAGRLRTGAPDLLAYMIREALDETEGKPDRLLLYVDQWEELYAQAPSGGNSDAATRHATDVTRFIDLLLTAARTEPVTVVGTVRADFYDPLIAHPKIRALLPIRQVLLGAMLRSDLERTIVEPARKARLAFDPPKLVQRILDEAGDDEGTLPLLQYALKESWALRDGNRITADSYTRSGGVREAIQVTAERTFEALSEEDQRAARQLFLRLVTPGEGQEDTRARADMPSEPPLRRIVDQFAGPRIRLLVTGLDRVLRPTVEVAHEALIRTWPRLRGWIDMNRDKLRARAAVLQARQEWEQQGRREDLLLRAGFQLERARTLLADPGDLAIDDIEEFIAISSAHEKAERKEREDALARDVRLQRIARWAFTALAAAILIAGTVVGYMLWDRARQLAIQLDTKEAALEHARANILGELSRTKLLRGEMDSALRLASQGARLDLALPSQAVEESYAAEALATAAAVTASYDKTHIWDAASAGGIAVRGVDSAAFSPDGLRIITASSSDARIWDARTAREIAVLPGVSSAAFSPDGSRIITTSLFDTARIWDARTAREIAVLPRVSSAAFSPDGSRIVTTSVDNTARIWDAVTAREIAVLRGVGGKVSSAPFSPDRSRIVTTSVDKTARIWDVATAAEITALRGHVSYVRSAVFSPDGSRIVTASADRNARIWDAATGAEIAIMDHHEGPVHSAHFSPDGSLIVTASEDNTARIWDAATAREIAVLRGHKDDVRSAVFSPDGSRIITASADGTVRIWDVHIQSLPVKDLLAQVCARLDIFTRLTRVEMRLAAYPDDMPEIDVCHGVTLAHDDAPRERAFAKKLAELEDPILAGIDKIDSVARNPRFWRGLLSVDYWTQLALQFWRWLRVDVFVALALGVLAVLALSRRKRRKSPPVARISENLGRSLRQAFAFAEERHHNPATSEHLLLALIDDPDAALVMRACHVDIEAVRCGLSSSLAVQRTVPEGASVGPHDGIQGVLQRAIVRVMASGNREVNGAGVLVEMLTEPAGEFLRQAGMTRLDAVNYISHGIIDHRGFGEGETPTAGGDQAVATGPEMLEVKLLNDDFTPMEFVVDVLQRVFDYEPKGAARVMLDIHRHGVGVCGIYPSDVARLKATKVQEYARGHEHPLRCVLGQP